MSRVLIDPGVKREIESEQKRWQRQFQLQGKRGTEYKLVRRWVRLRGTGTRHPIYWVVAHDTTREGTDGSLGTPEVVGGPFAHEEEGHRFVSELKAGKMTFFFGRRKFDLTPPAAAAAEAEQRAVALRASLDPDVP